MLRGSKTDIRMSMYIRMSADITDIRMSIHLELTQSASVTAEGGLTFSVTLV